MVSSASAAMPSWNSGKTKSPLSAGIAEVGSASHQNKMFAVFPILREYSDPHKKGGGSIQNTLYFTAADRPSDIVRKVRQQLAAAGIDGNAMEAMLALDTSPIRAQNLKSARTIAPQM